MKRLFKKLICCVLLVVFAVSLTACKSVDFDVRSYTMIEPGISHEIIYTGEVYHTKTNNAEYYFEPSIKKEAMQSFVKNSEQALKVIDFIAHKIYVLQDYDFAIFNNNIYTDKEIIYTSIQANKTIDYLAILLLAKHNKFGNYGLAYALANYYCKNLKWQQANVPQNELPNESIAYDLNLLNFSPQYSSLEEIKIAQKASLNFLDYLKITQSTTQIENLLSDKAAFKVKLAQFYNSINVSHTPTEISYGFGGQTYEFVAYTEYATFFVRKDWANYYLTDIINETLLHCDYRFTNHYFSETRNDMIALQEIVGLDDYNNSLSVYFCHLDAYDGSSYQKSSHIIQLSEIASFSHEYVHSITLFNTILLEQHAQLITEGIASFLGSGYGYYSQTVYQYIFKQYSEEYYDALEELIKYLGRNIDYSIDRRIYTDYMTYKTTTDFSNYSNRESFFLFLSDTLTTRQIIDALISQTGEFEPLPKTIEEYRTEWATYINEKFKDFDVS